MNRSFNATADNNDNPTAENWYLYVMIAVQLLIQLLLFLLIFAALSGTYLFQVGLLGVLIGEFKGMLIAIPAYLVVYIAYAAVKIAGYTSNGSNQDALWNSGLFVFFSIVQKLASMAYCVTLVSRFHALGEARWYQRKPWLNFNRPQNTAGSTTIAAAAQQQVAVAGQQRPSGPVATGATTTAASGGFRGFFGSLGGGSNSSSNRGPTTR